MHYEFQTHNLKIIIMQLVQQATVKSSEQVTPTLLVAFYDTWRT